MFLLPMWSVQVTLNDLRRNRKAIKTKGQKMALERAEIMNVRLGAVFWLFAINTQNESSWWIPTRIRMVLLC